MKLLVGLALVLCASAATVWFEENFDTADWEKRWVPSEWKSDMGQWKWTHGEWFVDEAVNKGIQTTNDMRHHAISAQLPASFSNRGKDLVVQFSVKHELKEYAFCGGGYIKLLPEGTDQKKFGGDSDYLIMFGPDLCGYDVSRIHLIFNHKGKNLLKNDEIKLDYNEKDEFTHLYTLVVHPDNTFEVYYDLKEKAKGSIIDGWDFPKKTIDDPKDKKPSDWVDEKEIVDPADKKPSDWDKPEYISDPDATKPEEWDDESDGEWEAPQIKNPEYKGEWKPKQIPNPAYKGKWIHPEIDNPEYTPDANLYRYKDISHIGLDLWQVKSGTIFDNILICDDPEFAKQYVKDNWEATRDGEKKMKEKQDEEDKKKREEEEAKRKAEEDAKKSEEGSKDDEDKEDDDEAKDEL